MRLKLIANQYYDLFERQKRKLYPKGKPRGYLIVSLNEATPKRRNLCKVTTIFVLTPLIKDGGKNKMRFKIYQRLKISAK